MTAQPKNEKGAEMIRYQAENLMRKKNYFSSARIFTPRVFL
jgi:hypothetical protein